MDQLLQLIKVQLWQFFREPSVLFWGIVFPVLMSWGLGVAFTKIGSVKHQIAVVEDSTGFSPLDSLLQKTATKFSKPLNKTVYSFTEHNEKIGDIEFVFCKTQADSAIVLMKRDLVSLMIREKNDKLSFEFDPQNSGSNLTYLHLTDILYNQSRKRTDELVEPLTLKGTRYIDFLIPGIIAMRIMSSALWGIGWTLIDTRSKKLLRRMIATPMKKSYYLVSHFIARLFLSVCEASLLFIFSYFYFGISIQGSILGVITIYLAGNVAFMGLATLLASRTAVNENANGMINLVTTPMMVVSGIFFSYSTFPEFVIPIIKLLPLTILADQLRSLFIEGASFASILFPSLELTVFGLLCFIAGLRIFKWY